MSARFFLPLHSIILDDSQPPVNTQCVAYLDDGDRCSSVIPELDLEAARSIFAAYDDDDDDDDDESENTLTELARLCLCHEAGHNTQKNVQAAAQEWMQMEPSTDAENTIHPAPAPSIPENKKVGSDQEVGLFEFGKESLARKADCDPTLADRRVKDLFTKPPSSCPGYIYLVDPTTTTGFYRIRFSSKQSDPVPDYDCYPKSKVYCCVPCKNTKLVKSLVLSEFTLQLRYHDCEATDCGVRHKNWIEAAGRDIKASIEAWSDLVETDYAGVQLPEAGFSVDPDRWTKWAQETAASLKIAARPPAAVPPAESPAVPSAVPPALPPRPAPAPHEHSDTSFSSETTTFSEVPPPSTPDTSASIHDRSFTSTTTDPVSDSPPRPRFEDWRRGKRDSLKKKFSKGADIEGLRSPSVLDVAKGIARNLVSK